MQFKNTKAHFLCKIALIYCYTSKLWRIHTFLGQKTKKSIELLLRR